MSRRSSAASGKRLIRGTASDNGRIASVRVNGQAVRAVRGDFSEWEIDLPVTPAEQRIIASAFDAAGNVEPRPHTVTLQ